MISYGLFEGRPLTTQGQWINPFLFACFALGKRLPGMRQIRKPVFIIGTGRSGTTILGKVLSMHREVGFLNEPKALWHSIYPNEDLVGSYSRGDANYRLAERDASSQTVCFARRLFGIYLAVTFSRRVVDKYPELVFRVPFVKAIFPDAKFLFLVRNGWDTCNSIEKWSCRLGKQAGGETHDWWGVNRRKWNLMMDQILPGHADLSDHVDEISQFDRHVDMAAVEWIVSMREGMTILDRLPDDVLRVTYEDLCREPRPSLHKILDFVGLSPDDKVFFNYGESVLTPRVAKDEVTLSPVIHDPFIRTMNMLGYKS